jgi:hypothetical protein
MDSLLFSYVLSYGATLSTRSRLDAFFSQRAHSHRKAALEVATQCIFIHTSRYALNMTSSITSDAFKPTDTRYFLTLQSCFESSEPPTYVSALLAVN